MSVVRQCSFNFVVTVNINSIRMMNNKSFLLCFHPNTIWHYFKKLFTNSGKALLVLKCHSLKSRIQSKVKMFLKIRIKKRN